MLTKYNNKILIEENILKTHNDTKDYFSEFPNFLSLFIRPVFFIALSPILLEVGASLSTNIRDLNLIFTFFTIGYLIGNLTSIFYNKKFQKLHVIIFSYIVLIGANIVLSLARSLYIYYFLYFLSGYVLGIIWIQANAFILESKIKNKVRLNMIALSFFPIGTLVTPFIVTIIVSNKLNWWYVYYVIIIIILIIVTLYLTITRKKKYDTRVKSKESAILKGIFTNKSKNIIIVIRIILTLLYTIPVTIIITWFPTFFRIEKMFNYKEAGLTISIFYTSMILGRVIISLLEKKIKMENIILIFTFIAFISLCFMVYSNYKYIIFIAEGFAGIGFSGIFPFLVSSVSVMYEKGRDVLITILFGAESLGAALAPYLTGSISKYNMTLSVSLSIIVSVVIFILFITDTLYEKRFLRLNKIN